MALAALCLKILIDAFGLPTPARAATPAGDPERDLLAALAVICSPGGLVNRGPGDTRGGGAPAPNSAAHDCSVCHCTTCGHAALMPAVEEGLPRAERTVFRPMAPPRPHLRPAAIDIRPRGPPGISLVS